MIETLPEDVRERRAESSTDIEHARASWRTIARDFGVRAGE